MKQLSRKTGPVFPQGKQVLLVLLAPVERGGCKDMVKEGENGRNIYENETC
jgi:hypothetical protein